MNRMLALLVAVAFSTHIVHAGDLVVHEWGTFTALQDEDGNVIGGINSDDEPLPRFVHSLLWDLQVGDAQRQASNRLQQGWPRAHPDVTMRLETPVIYFYPPAEAKRPITLDVHVQFRGGMLTQFYPAAETNLPGRNMSAGGYRIDGETIGKLSWRDLQIGVDRDGPATDEHVWLAPRKVSAASVATPDGEAEKYLFYRGVGHLDPPLKIARDGDILRITGRLGSDNPSRGPRPMWLAHIDPAGRCAYRIVHSIDARHDRITAAVPASFADEEYQPDTTSLRREMRGQLVDAGLFDDEAEAMLSTWELSYFKSPGLRLFFLVPRAWTDQVLPLEISVPCTIERVMVGRIDLVTPEHRQLLQQIAQANDVTSEEVWQLYDDLGRFRNALVLDELSRRPTEPLQRFIRERSLEAFPLAARSSNEE